MNALAALVLAVVALACVVATRRPFVGLLAYLWLDFMRVHDMDADVRRWRPMLLIGVVTLAATAWRRRGRVYLDAIPPALLALVGIVVLGAVWRGDPAAISGVVEVLKMLAVVWLIRTLVTTPGRLHLVMAVIASSLAVHAAGVVRQGVARGLMHEFHVELVVKGPGIEFGGALVDNNDLARVLAVGLGLWWALATWPERRWLRTLSAAGLLLAGLGIVYTFSRGGFVAMCVAIAAASIGRWPISRGALIAALVIAAIVALAPAPYRSRVATIRHASGEASVRGRVDVWREAARLIRERPLLGRGVGSFDVVVGAGTSARHRTSHNIFVELAVETGILGLAAFVWMICASVATLLAAHRRGAAGSWLRASSDGVLASVLAYVTASLALSAAFQSPLFVLVGLAGALGSMASSAELRPAPRSSGEALGSPLRS